MKMSHKIMKIYFFVTNYFLINYMLLYYFIPNFFVFQS